MKVLFVQKEPLLTAALKLTLQKQGYEVVFCKEALHAVSLIKDTNPNLVIADIMLSANGERVISQAKIKNIPVIVLSEMTNEKAAQQAFELNADDYASLPVSLPELSLRINKLTHFRA
jgi:two-component system, OmpR family, response regulator